MSRAAGIHVSRLRKMRCVNSLTPRLVFAISVRHYDYGVSALRRDVQAKDVIGVTHVTSCATTGVDTG